MTAGIIIVVILAALAAWLAATYNSLVRLRGLAQEAFATMDVYLKKRWDLVPNLVETVKGYARHEQKTLQELTSLRAGSYENLSSDDKIDVNQKISQNLSKIIAVAENYPELKANANFAALQSDLGKIEDDIANSRKYYNGTVRQYNTKLQTFPTNLLAGMFHFQPEKLFAAGEHERENVKVSFQE